MFNKKLLKRAETVIQCRTKEQTQLFMSWCLENDLEYMGFCVNVWDTYKDRTCYSIRDVGTYCNRQYFEDCDYTVLSFEESLLSNTKYELVKSFSVPDLIQLNACEQSVKKVVEKYGVYNLIPWNSETEMFIHLNDKTWFKWLIDCDLIKEKNEQKFDFDNKIQAFFIDDEVFKLCRIGLDKYQWCSIDSTMCYWTTKVFNTLQEAVKSVLECDRKSEIEIKEFDNIEDLYNYYYTQNSEIKDNSDVIKLVYELCESSTGCYPSIEGCEFISDLKLCDHNCRSCLLK